MEVFEELLTSTFYFDHNYVCYNKCSLSDTGTTATIALTFITVVVTINIVVQKQEEHHQ